MPDGASLWDLEKEWRGLPASTPLPTSLAAYRASKQDDGVAHCETCGGIAFSGVLVFTSDGTPARVLTPQTCLGCGALRKANWPS